MAYRGTPLTQEQYNQVEDRISKINFTRRFSFWNYDYDETRDLVRSFDKSFNTDEIIETILAQRS